MRRVVIPELLDSDAGSAAEIAASLSDLRRINRWFGGIGTTGAMLDRVVRRIGRRELSLLDVAAGSGDVPLALKRRLRAQGVSLRVTLADRSLEHLHLARDDRADVRVGVARLRANSGRSARDDKSVRRVVADALALPFLDESFDVVCCGLFAHHLEPHELQRFVGEALRVCRTAVLINDLRRSAISLGLIYAGFPLFRSRLTRHDAPASARRAYTIPEMQSILRQAAARQVEIHRHYLFRMGVMVWK